MADEFVKREEFNELKRDVEKIKDNEIENAKTLQSIDNKVSIIKEKLTSSDEINDLKLKPLSDRVDKLEDSKKWLWRTIGTTAIGLVFELIVGLIVLVK